MLFKRLFVLLLALALPTLSLAQTFGTPADLGKTTTQLKEIFTVATLPAANSVPAGTTAYTSDGGLRVNNGTAWVVVAAGGGGAPADAKYIVQTADATLSAEQAMSALGTGLIKNTTATGVFSIGAYTDVTTLFASGTCPSSGSRYLATDGTCPVLSGGGDASTNTASSVDSEVVLFSSTGGKTLKRATTTGILKGTSGVLSAAAGSDVVGLFTGTPNGAKFLRDDGTLATPAGGSGDPWTSQSCTTNCTISTNYRRVDCDATAGNVTVTLGALATYTDVEVGKIDTSANTCTVDPNASETIGSDAHLTDVIVAPDTVLTYRKFSSTNWLLR